MNLVLKSSDPEKLPELSRKFVRVSALATITHLKKFIAIKVLNMPKDDEDIFRWSYDLYPRCWTESTSETLTSPARGSWSPRITLSSLFTSLDGEPKTLPSTLSTGLYPVRSWNSRWELFFQPEDQAWHREHVRQGLRHSWVETSTQALLRRRWRQLDHPVYINMLGSRDFLN